MRARLITLLFIAALLFFSSFMGGKVSAGELLGERTAGKAEIAWGVRSPSSYPSPTSGLGSSSPPQADVGLRRRNPCLDNAGQSRPGFGVVGRDIARGVPHVWGGVSADLRKPVSSSCLSQKRHETVTAPSWVGSQRRASPRNTVGIVGCVPTVSSGGGSRGSAGATARGRTRVLLGRERSGASRL